MAGKFPNKRRDTSGPKQSERTAKVKSRLADAEKRAAAGDLAGAAAYAKAALAIQRKGTGGQKSLQRVANVANAYSRAAGQGGVKAGKVARKPAKSGTGKAGTTSTTGTTKAGSQSYVGKPGTRTKSYQTGEGMTVQSRKYSGPRTFSGSSVTPSRKTDGGSSKKFYQPGGGGLVKAKIDTQFSVDRQGGFKWGANWKWNGKKWVKG